MSVSMASNLLLWFLFSGERFARVSLQSWFRGDSEVLGTVMSVTRVFTIHEIATYQDSPGSDRDVSACFNLEALSGGIWAISSVRILID